MSYAWLGQTETDRLELENYSAYLRSKRPPTGGAEGHGVGGELRTPVVSGDETTSASPVGGHAEGSAAPAGALKAGPHLMGDGRERALPSASADSIEGRVGSLRRVLFSLGFRRFGR